MRSLAVFALAFIVACAPRAFPPAGAECRRTSEVYLDPAFRADEREDIARAVGAWTRALHGAECFALSDDALGADVRILRAEREADVLDLHPVNIAGLWAPTPRRIWIVVESRTDTEKATIAAHELGHYLGLDHAHEPSGASIVNPVLSDDLPLVEGAEIPAVDVASYWRAHL